MKRSQLPTLPEYFDRYINMTDDVELLDAIQKSIDELDTIPIQKWRAKNCPPLMKMNMQRHLMPIIEHWKV